MNLKTILCIPLILLPCTTFASDLQRERLALVTSQLDQLKLFVMDIEKNNTNGDSLVFSYQDFYNDIDTVTFGLNQYIQKNIDTVKSNVELNGDYLDATE